MDLTALRAEFDDFGFARLTTARRDVLINRAKDELDELELWPYREKSVTGTAPLAISDLGEVDQVFDMSGTDSLPLTRRSYAELVSDYADLDTTGSDPWFWYKATPAGVPTVATYPVATGQIGVQYYRFTPPLAAGGDEPLAPERFHGIYSLIAERMAHASKGDKATASAVQDEVDRAVMRMRLALLPDDQQAFQIMTDASVDG